jgi:outer membrane protein TolC
LQLAAASNLDVAQAREVVAQARAALTRANVLALPTFVIGSAYANHQGQIQKTEGNIITANKNSLFVGGGPTLSFQLTDALFGPHVARDLAAAVRAGVQRINNETLLAVADAYFNVQRARRRLARVEDTLEYLTSEKTSETRGGLKGLLPLVRDFVEVGGKDALASDLARTQVEVLRRREERTAALQEYRIASAELARLLRLDPAVVLVPGEDLRVALLLPGQEWMDRPLEDLVAFALASRPELAENQALVQAALDRVRQAKWRPYLPNAGLTFNWGDFGGAPDPNPNIILPPATRGGPVRVQTQPGFGSSGPILHFAPRTDFDAGLTWRLSGMGLGNRAEVREQEAAHRRAQFIRLEAYDRVTAQVVQSREALQDWRERVGITRSALFDDRGEPTGPVFRSLRLNFDRIRGGEGRPLEVLDAIRGLSDLLDAYGTATSEYERSQFRLLFALGVPTEALFDPPPAK